MRGDVVLLLASAVLGLGATLGAIARAESAGTVREVPDPTADPWITQAGFLNAHRDLYLRQRGVSAYREGDYSAAYRYFRRAAYQADKPSQGMVAEMLWQGLGVDRDRALAYAWMDLAAERGYRDLAARREKYWHALDEAERARALAEGAALYDKYGDDVALPRYATRLRIERSRTTGSRTGFASNLQIWVPIGTNANNNMPSFVTLDGSKYYARQYWDPAAYAEWQDASWEAKVDNVPAGQVEVSDPEPIRDP